MTMYVMGTLILPFAKTNFRCHILYLVVMLHAHATLQAGPD